MRYLYTSWHFCIPTYRLHGTRTIRCWYGTRRAEDTSTRRFSPGACVGCASALRSRPLGLRGEPSPPEPAPRPERRAAPGGGRVGGVQRRCGAGAVWLWRGVFDRLWHESSCAAPSIV